MSELRIMRGQVVVREHLDADYEQYKHIIVPGVTNSDEKHALARRRTWHRGEVIAIGPPAQTVRGVDVPHGFNVGDVVIFHWELNEENFTREWQDGKTAAWVPQHAIDAVME